MSRSPYARLRKRESQAAIRGQVGETRCVECTDEREDRCDEDEKHEERGSIIMKAGTNHLSDSLRGRSEFGWRMDHRIKGLKLPI